MGGIPVIVDVDPVSYCINFDKIPMIVELYLYQQSMVDIPSMLKKELNH